MKHLSKNVQRVLAAALMTILLVGVAAGASTVTKKMIEANYMGIKLVVDGVEITPRDANGKVVEPFASEGTTYLPVRAVGEALGKEVSWEGSTKTVYVGKAPDAEENWITKVPIYQTYNGKVYDGSDRKVTFDVAGITQSHGVVFSTSLHNAFAIWNTNSLYNTMTFTIGHMSTGTTDAKMEVRLDGEYSTEYLLKFDAAPRTINIPLDYAPNVELIFTSPSGGDLHGTWGLYDLSFS